MAKPHIVAIIADDYGWGNIGYHRATPTREVATPTLDALVADGVELTRHYAYKFCSPSRSAFQSGRLPVHVNFANAEPTVSNPADPIGGYAGIPVNMTGVAQLMRKGGYRTYFTGKWDAGMATPRHTPIGRGYENWLGYYHHANDYWTERLEVTATGTIDVCGNRYVDLWSGHAPARALNGTAYEEELFTNHSLGVIAAHDTSTPLFLVHAFHIVHTPLQVPSEYEQRFGFIDQHGRRTYAAMVNYMDGVVGRLCDTLRQRSMWGSTLLMFTSDNGGGIYFPASASNHPLRGGKENDWEGGVRMNAFLAGGFLPDAARGMRLDALMHIADWYATFAGLAGIVNATHDAEAAAAGLPPVDSIDVWPWVLDAAARRRAVGGAEPNASTAAASARMASVAAGEGRGELQLSAQALLQRGPSGELFKLVTGWQVNTGWVGAVYPNRTGPQPLPSPIGRVPPHMFHTWSVDCGEAGCLFDVEADETEHRNLAAQRPALAQQLKARLDELNKGLYTPDRGKGDKAACRAAEDLYGGFYGPFIGV